MVGSGVILQVVVILIAGLIATRIGKKYDVPVIIPLLIAGYILGPDVLNYLNLNAYGLNLGMLAAIAVPVILFYDGLKADPKTIGDYWKTVLSINTLAVLVTVFGIAGSAHYVLGLSWLASFLLGAILASTDPAAILPILRKLNVDKKVSSILETETAFNDAAALALFGVIMSVAVTQTFSLQEGFVQFLTLFFWSILLGFVVGLAARELFVRFKIGHDLTFASFAVLLASIIVASVFQVNGAIAAVVSAVIFGEYVRSKHVESIQRMYALSAWEDINFLAIALVFIGLGSQLALAKIMPFLLVGIAIAVVFMYVVRPVTILVSMAFDKSFSLREKLFIAFIGGPRGTVSAALAASALVAAPIGVLTQEGMQFVFYVTLVVIITTIVATSASATYITEKLLGVRENVSEERYRALRADLKGMMMASRKLREEWKSGIMSNKMYSELDAQQSALIKAAEQELARIAKTNPHLEFREKLDKTRELMAAQINTLEESYTNKELSEKSYDELLEKYNSVLGRLSELEGEKNREHDGQKPAQASRPVRR